MQSIPLKMFVHLCKLAAFLTEGELGLLFNSSVARDKLLLSLRDDMTGVLTLVTDVTCKGWMQVVETGLTTSERQHEGEFC